MLLKMEWLLLLMCVCCAVSENVTKVSTPANDLYTESPCEIRSLSAYKDSHGNVWGVGNGNLWWFNATNLSWSLLPLPNGTTTSEPWTVKCVQPRKYVVIVSRNFTLVLHLPWQHWQMVETEDLRKGPIDKDATWCVYGLLFALDRARETLYLLDHEEARWTLKSDLPAVHHENGSSTGLVNTWFGPDSELILVEKFGINSHLWYTNASGKDYGHVAENDGTNRWPDLDQGKDGLSLTFNLGSENMWLWMENKVMKNELWSFEFNTSTWKRANPAFTKKLPSLKNVLAAWEDGHRYCVLTRSGECNAQYSVSRMECWCEQDMLPVVVDTDKKTLTSSTTTTTTQKPPKTNKPKQILDMLHKTTESDATSESLVLSAPSSTTTELPRPKVNASRLKPLPDHSKFLAKMLNELLKEDDGSVEASQSKMFSSIHTENVASFIFFATSITMFALVGLWFCGKRCVHFPKEALLLRDPPNVRYTAIPDSLGFNTHKVSSTYTVIPDPLA